ncbi:MAG TPA: IS110 family transposase [Bacteroidia bacterium]|nr:IS110 family transposase [Bacteroidia bacterium]
MVKLQERADFSGKKIFVGMDVHSKNWNNSIYYEGQFLRSFQQPPKVEALVKLLRRDYPGAEYYCAYEAGFCGFWIQRELEKEGVKCIVVHAADVPQTDKRKRNKTDPNDSKGIGTALQAGLLKAIYVPDTITEGNRKLVRYRQQVRKDLTRCRSRIKGLIHNIGIPLPSQFSMKNWSRAFIKWLQELRIEHHYIRYALDSLIAQEARLRAEILLLNKELKNLLKTNRYQKEGELLTGIPGIGTTTAVTMLVEIGDIKRFSSFSQFNSFVGFYPSEFSSGEHEHKGSIMPRHHRELRSLIIEAAWISVRHDPALTLAFGELKKRMTAKRAIIRIARKLLNRIWHVWNKQEEYEKGLVA